MSWAPLLIGYGGVARRPFQPQAGVWPENMGHLCADVLSKLPRFGGAYPGPTYSVAQHCCTLAALFPHNDVHGRDVLRACSMVHEVYEALTGLDVPTPLKRTWPDYRAGEELALREAAKTYRLPWPLPPAVSNMDERVGATEARLLIPDGDWDMFWPGVDPLESLPYAADRWSQEEAADQFLTRWDTYVEHNTEASRTTATRQ